jgi:hypothetical protein
MALIKTPEKIVIGPSSAAERFGSVAGPAGLTSSQDARRAGPVNCIRLVGSEYV